MPRLYVLATSGPQRSSTVIRPPLPRLKYGLSGWGVGQMPWDWYDKEGPERVDFVLSSLAQVQDGNGGRGAGSESVMWVAVGDRESQVVDELGES